MSGSKPQRRPTSRRSSRRGYAGEVNDALRVLFACFVLDLRTDGAIVILPILLPSTARIDGIRPDGAHPVDVLGGRITSENFGEHGGLAALGPEPITPPLREIEARSEHPAGNVRDSHPSADKPEGLPLPPLRVTV